MEEKLPFYMVYPMPFLYEDDRLNQRDYEYMKSLYPKTAKRLMPYVEEECDRLEYTGSMMYDEYPDRFQLEWMCKRIYENYKDEEEKPEEWLMNLIQVMAYQELCYRRHKRRGYKKRYY